MFVPLFAADADPSGPWWVTAILVPFGISVVSIFGSLYLISRTEWYRRLARWEPYAEKLRTVQMDVYVGVCDAATDAMRQAYEYVNNVRQGEREHNKPFLNAWRQKEAALRALDARTAILLSSQFNVAYNSFVHSLFMFSTETGNDSDSRKRASEERDKLEDLCVELIYTARQSLETDTLDQKVKDAIRTMLKEPTEKCNRNTLGSNE